MRVQVEDQYAKCPYCGSIDFASDADPAGLPPQEVVCARCGGYASRKLLIDALRAACAKGGGRGT
jgi:hypothetical protein